jgi:hypothetical protein
MEKIVELIKSNNIELGVMLAFSQYGKNEDTFKDLIIELIENKINRYNDVDYYFDICIELSNNYILSFWNSYKENNNNIIRIGILDNFCTTSHDFDILSSFNIPDNYTKNTNSIIVKMTDLNEIHLSEFTTFLKDLFHLINNNNLLDNYG